MIEPIYTAYRNQAEKQLSGVFSSLQLPLNKMYTPEVFWVLSGTIGSPDSVDLDVNHPDHPTLLTIGNNPQLMGSFSPIIALIATVCMKHMNQQRKHPSIFMLDEAPTLFIPGLEQLPATARANQVCTILCVQDFEQLSGMYGRSRAEVLRNNLGNQFFGMSGNLATCSYVSQLSGHYSHLVTSLHMTEHKESVTKNLHKESYLTPHDVASQAVGHFVIKTAGQNPKFVSTQLPDHGDGKNSISPLPIQANPLLETRVQENWNQIHNQVQKISQLKQEKA